MLARAREQTITTAQKYKIESGELNEMSELKLKVSLRPGRGEIKQLVNKLGEGKCAMVRVS